MAEGTNGTGRGAYLQQVQLNKAATSPVLKLGQHDGVGTSAMSEPAVQRNGRGCEERRAHPRKRRDSVTRALCVAYGDGHTGGDGPRAAAGLPTRLAPVPAGSETVGLRGEARSSYRNAFHAICRGRDDLTKQLHI